MKRRRGAKKLNVKPWEGPYPFKRHHRRDGIIAVRLNSLRNLKGGGKRQREPLMVFPITSPESVDGAGLKAGLVIRNKIN